MKHLSENEFIDYLFEPGAHSDAQKHLDHCVSCMERFRLLRDGLSLAQQSEPEPLLFEPDKKVKSFWKKPLVAVAAMLLVCSVLGFRAEYQNGKVAIQFSLLPFSQNKGVSDDQLQEQLAALEQRVAEALNYQAETTANQLNEQFAALQKSQYRDLVELSIQVKESLNIKEIQTGKRLAMLNRNLEALKSQAKAGPIEGTLQ